MKLGRTEVGLTHFRAATEFAPDDVLAWYGLAQALEVANDSKGAETAYRRVIELDEHGNTAKMARRGLSQLAQQTFRAAYPGVERPDAVWYCMDALGRFEKMPSAEVQKIGFEIALLGCQGLQLTNPAIKYMLRSLTGEYTSLHLICSCTWRSNKSRRSRISGSTYPKSTLSPVNFTPVKSRPMLQD